MGGDGCLRDVSQNTVLETEFPLLKRGWNSVGKVKHMQRVPVCYHSTLPAESPGPEFMLGQPKAPFREEPSGETASCRPESRTRHSLEAATDLKVQRPLLPSTSDSSRGCREEKRRRSINHLISPALRPLLIRVKAVAGKEGTSLVLVAMQHGLGRSGPDDSVLINLRF